MKHVGGMLLIAVSTPLIIGTPDGLGRKMFVGAMLLVYAVGLHLSYESAYDPDEDEQ